MNNLFLLLNIVQALIQTGILIALIIIILQFREIAKTFLFADSFETGVENPDAKEPDEDYTNTGESLAEILNKRLREELGDNYESYIENRHGKINSYSDLENDFGITGAEIITDEDETKRGE
jgi:hypothetical protein